MNSSQKITVIGSDSSHIIAFAKLFQKKENDWNWQISTVIKHDKSEMPISVNRKAKIEKQITELGIALFDEYNSEVLEQTDAFIIGNVDANYHKEILERIAPFQKPVFIDKPIAYSLEETDEIFKVAEENQIAIFSSSSLRFSESFVRALEKVKCSKGVIHHVKLNGPITFLPEIKGLYWYGIHIIEMIERLEAGVCTLTNYEDNVNRIILNYQGENIDYTILGDKTGKSSFSGELTTGYATYYFDSADDSEPLYFFLIEKMITFFETGIAPVLKQHTKNVIKMIHETNNEAFKK